MVLLLPVLTVLFLHVLSLFSLCLVIWAAIVRPFVVQNRTLLYLMVNILFLWCCLPCWVWDDIVPHVTPSVFVVCCYALLKCRSSSYCICQRRYTGACKGKKRRARLHISAHRRAHIIKFITGNGLLMNKHAKVQSKRMNLIIHKMLGLPTANCKSCMTGSPAAKANGCLCPECAYNL